MHVETFSLGPLGTNCYIISKDHQCLIIDPGGDPHIIEDYLMENKLTPQAILLTHAHFDHIGAVDEIRNKYKLNVYLHNKEKDWLEDATLNRSILFLGSDGFVTSPPDKIIQTGELKIGEFVCEIVHTPGHSPGSVSFIFRDHDFVVSGDVLFNRGIGRTDLPEGSIEQLANSIVTHLYTLPDHFTVYPGHGPATQIGDEKKANPFTLQFYRP
ncbi:MBL fold metallo-hydrolase [Pseudogracilibacillus sp. SE30717A]|uniref:MBL fold metallo-hydrolase n=1 Tax=Pseudogracilibacillus sp. SE30717A TaxID=3098293 RepID=UPI00300E3723